MDESNMDGPSGKPESNSPSEETIQNPHSIGRHEHINKVSLHYWVTYGNGHQCCGFLLTPSWVGTAAHCLIDIERTKEVLPTRYFYVLASTADLLEREYYYQKRYPDTFIPHPNFSWSLLYNDIGLIRVDRPFEYNGKIGLAILPTTDLNYELEPWMSCTVAGWGVTEKENLRKVSSRLMSTTLQIVPQVPCEISIGGTFFLNPTGSICTMSPTGETDACKGDSGSPLLCALPKVRGGILVPELAADWVLNGWRMDKSKHDKVVGLVSWSWKCAEEGVPAIHTDIRNYVEWMKYTIALNFELTFASGVKLMQLFDSAKF